MNLKTGFGYYVDSKGKKIHKFELPIGTHPDPKGYSVVEVPSKAALDKIVLEKSDAQIEREAIKAKKVELRKNFIAKIKNVVGLTDEEIEAAIGG